MLLWKNLKRGQRNTSRNTMRRCKLFYCFVVNKVQSAISNFNAGTTTCTWVADCATNSCPAYTYFHISVSSSWLLLNVNSAAWYLHFHDKVILLICFTNTEYILNRILEACLEITQQACYNKAVIVCNIFVPWYHHHHH